MNKNEQHQTIEQALAGWLRTTLKALFPEVNLDSAAIFAAPTADEKFGDYQTNAAMTLKKLLNLPPRAIAQKLVDGATLPEFIEKMEIAGPGFVNFFLQKEWLSKRLCDLQADERLGTPVSGEGRTIVMDYGGPNITKPLHIGHLRSPNIGSAVDRMFRFLGYRVIADSHLGDWGTQFGITIMGYRTFGDAEAMAREPMEELERVYVKSYDQSKTDPNWLDQCRRELVKLQAGDPENLALWKKFVELSMRELEKIYSRLGVKFDLVRGESYYNDQLPGTIQMLKDKGLLRESEGAQVVFLEEEKLPVCIVQKSDGGFNYATTDLATIQSRLQEFHPDRIIYFTDERQQLHFRQIFAISRRLGITTRLDHVWFGLMRLPEGTFSTREGNVIPLEKLLDDAESRALEIVKKSSPDMPSEQMIDVARSVGVGAVKYADVSQNPQSLVTFTWDKAMALEGNSAPYLQYAYARISSVKDKYAERFPGKDPQAWPIRISEPIERTLAMKILRFADVLINTAENCRPNMLADYLYDLAQNYSSFYQNVPFLKAEEGVRESRVRLCDLTARTLKKGLQLLGIETPERI